MASGKTGVPVSFDRIHKSFGPVRVLEELNLQVEPGEFLVLLGASGSGKTTALRLPALAPRIREVAGKLDGHAAGVEPIRGIHQGLDRLQLQDTAVFQDGVMHPNRVIPAFPAPPAASHLVQHQRVDLALGARVRMAFLPSGLARAGQMGPVLDARPPGLSHVFQPFLQKIGFVQACHAFLFSPDRARDLIRSRTCPVAKLRRHHVFLRPTGRSLYKPNPNWVCICAAWQTA